MAKRAILCSLVSVMFFSVTTFLLSLGLQEGQVFFYLLIACRIINSCYTLLWDLKMDWGLFDRKAGENTLLREEIVYPQKVRIHTHTSVVKCTNRDTKSVILKCDTLSAELIRKHL